MNPALRALGLGAIAVGFAACFTFDYTGAQCHSGVCPLSYRCLEGRCVGADAGVVDAGVDGGPSCPNMCALRDQYACAANGLTDSTACGINGGPCVACGQGTTCQSGQCVGAAAGLQCYSAGSVPSWARLITTDDGGVAHYAMGEGVLAVAVADLDADNVDEIFTVQPLAGLRLLRSKNGALEDCATSGTALTGTVLKMRVTQTGTEIVLHALVDRSGALSVDAVRWLKTQDLSLATRHQECGTEKTNSSIIEDFDVVPGAGDAGSVVVCAQSNGLWFLDEAGRATQVDSANQHLEVLASDEARVVAARADETQLRSARAPAVVEGRRVGALASLQSRRGTPAEFLARAGGRWALCAITPGADAGLALDCASLVQQPASGPAADLPFDGPLVNLPSPVGGPLGLTLLGPTDGGLARLSGVLGATDAGTRELEGDLQLIDVPGARLGAGQALRLRFRSASLGGSEGAVFPGDGAATSLVIVH